MSITPLRGSSAKERRGKPIADTPSLSAFMIRLRAIANTVRWGHERAIGTNVVTVPESDAVRLMVEKENQP
jgi:hypothetical protein